MRGAAQEGERVFARLARNTGSSETALSLDSIGRAFRHDGGFVGQNGVRRAELFQSLGWQGLGPFNEFYLNINAIEVRDARTGELVQQVIRPGLWSSGASNLEWRANLFVSSRLRTASGAPLLDEHYVNTGLVVTPARWFPLLDTWVDIGQLADTVAGRVRAGGRGGLTAKLRPLAPLELEPSLSQAWLREGGELKYREASLQWLAVWHFDARHSLRAIVQRSALDRRAEPGVAAASADSAAESLTYAWRRSAGTLFYVGATRSRASDRPPVSEAFVKLQFDVDELRAPGV